MPTNKPSIITLIILLVAGFVAAAAFHYINNTVPQTQTYQDVPPDTTPASTTPVTKPPVSTGTPAPQPKPGPTTLNLPIPFTSQAPTGNWDELHNEACEEASTIMANAYLTGDTETVIPASRVESEISKLTTWQDQNFGYHLDTTAAETVKMIQSVYGLEAKIVNDYSFDDLKNELNQHHVVILPVNGQVIGNPNYKQPGPIYHMLVIRGYTSTGLITDDSGTRKGQNYPYAFQTLYNAGADWNHSTNTIDKNKHIMIVVWK